MYFFLNIQKYNFACCSVWVSNWFSHLREFEYRVLGKLLGLSGVRQRERGENYNGLMTCTPHQILFG
jgi:hypothetical protein